MNPSGRVEIQRDELAASSPYFFNLSSRSRMRSLSRPTIDVRTDTPTSASGMSSS